MAQRAEIELHYDDPDSWTVFQTVLGRDYVYSCGQWENAPTLEAAQAAKMRKMLGFAGVTGDTRSLLDVGCGWGGGIAHARRLHPSLGRVVGLTLCRRQHEIATSIFAADSAVAIAEADCYDWLGQTNETFDSAISICAFEHFASPKHYRSGAHIERYRRFFELMHARVRGRFGLQTIVVTNAKVSEEQRRGHFRMLLILGRELFPKSLLASVEEIERAADPYYRVEQRDLHSDNYAKTLTAWRERLELCRERVPAATYDRFCRYFEGCRRQFEHGTIALSQYSLSPRR